jgi:hypothetical protein
MSPTPVIIIFLTDEMLDGAELVSDICRGAEDAVLKLFRKNKDIRISLSDLVILFIKKA